MCYFQQLLFPKPMAYKHRSYCWSFGEGISRSQIMFPFDEPEPDEPLPPEEPVVVVVVAVPDEEPLPPHPAIEEVAPHWKLQKLLSPPVSGPVQVPAL